MVRGKYAARAANRAVELDATIIHELRQKVARVEAERDALRVELDRVLRDFDADTHIVGERLAAETVAAVRAEMEALQVERDADRGRYAQQVFDVIGQCGGELPMEGFSQLAEVFDMGSQVGRLLNIEGQNRTSRRANAKVLRAHVEMDRQRRRVRRDEPADE